MLVGKAGVGKTGLSCGLLLKDAGNDGERAAAGSPSGNATTSTRRAVSGG